LKLSLYFRISPQDWILQKNDHQYHVKLTVIAQEFQRSVRLRRAFSHSLKGTVSPVLFLHAEWRRATGWKFNRVYRDWKYRKKMKIQQNIHAMFMITSVYTYKLIVWHYCWKECGPPSPSNNSAMPYKSVFKLRYNVQTISFGKVNGIKVRIVRFDVWQYRESLWICWRNHSTFSCRWD